MLNHPLQSPQLQTLLTHCQTSLGNAQQSLGQRFEAISQQLSSTQPIQPPTNLSVPQKRIGQRLLIVIAAIALLLWNWKLLLALAIGALAIALTRHVQAHNSQPWITGLRNILTGPHRLLLLSLPFGGLAMLSTYMVVSTWDELHSPWLISCLLLQSFLMLLGLALLSAQFLNQQSDRYDHSLDSALADLTNPNPLHRLVAVRQLNHLLHSRSLTPEQTRFTTQALQLLLNQETESLVREATLRSLNPE